MRDELDPTDAERQPDLERAALSRVSNPPIVAPPPASATELGSIRRGAAASGELRAPASGPPPAPARRTGPAGPASSGLPWGRTAGPLSVSSLRSPPGRDTASRPGRTGTVHGHGPGDRSSSASGGEGRLHDRLPMPRQAAGAVRRSEVDREPGELVVRQRCKGGRGPGVQDLDRTVEAAEEPRQEAVVGGIGIDDVSGEGSAPPRHAPAANQGGAPRRPGCRPTESAVGTRPPQERISGTRRTWASSTAVSPKTTRPPSHSIESTFMRAIQPLQDRIAGDRDA